MFYFLLIVHMKILTRTLYVLIFMWLKMSRAHRVKEDEIFLQMKLATLFYLSNLRCCSILNMDN